MTKTVVTLWLLLLTSTSCGGGDTSTPDTESAGCDQPACASEPSSTPEPEPPPEPPVRVSPEVLTFEASFNGPAEFSSTLEGERRRTKLSGVASRDAVVTPDLNDSVKLPEAASWRVLRPDPGGCTLAAVQVILVGRPPAALFHFGADDLLPTTACLDWLTAINQTGFSFEYLDVPYVLGGRAKRVTVSVVPNPNEVDG